MIDLKYYQELIDESPRHNKTEISKEKLEELLHEIKYLTNKLKIEMERIEYLERQIPIPEDEWDGKGN